MIKFILILVLFIPLLINFFIQQNISIDYYSILNIEWTSSIILVLLSVICLLLVHYEIAIKNYLLEAKDLYYQRNLNKNKIFGKTSKIIFIVLIAILLFIYFNYTLYLKLYKILDTILLLPDYSLYLISHKLQNYNLPNITMTIYLLTQTLSNLFGPLFHSKVLLVTDPYAKFHFLFTNWFFNYNALEFFQKGTPTELFVYSELCIAFTGLFFYLFIYYLGNVLYHRKVSKKFSIFLFLSLFVIHIIVNIMRFSVIIIGIMTLMSLNWSEHNSFIFMHDLIGNIYYILAYFTFMILITKIFEKIFHVNQVD